MQIQRIQSVYLFLAAALMIVYCVIPFAALEANILKPAQFPVYMTLNALAALLLVIDIFLYGNLRLQKTVARIAAALIACSAACGCILAGGGEHLVSIVNFEWTAALVLVCSFVLTILGLRAIRSDEKLLKSADRLR